MDCDNFVLGIETPNKNNELEIREDLFDYSNLNENHELFSIKNKKVVGKFKIATPEIILIDNFVCLRSKAFSFKCGNENTNRLEVFSISYSKNIGFDEYKKFLDGEDYRKECDNYIIRSLILEMCLQLIQKSILSLFEAKRC